MTGKELTKLVVLVLLIGVVFATGFTIGQGLERRSWQFEAVRKYAGRWVRHPQTHRWEFEWRDLPQPPRQAPPPAAEPDAADPAADDAKPVNPQ